MASSILVISSGIGSPAECELAVGKMLGYLRTHHAVEVLDISEGRSGHPRSVMLSSDEDLSMYAGAVQWHCPSPLRPGHGRKNWFIEVSFCRSEEKVGGFDESLVTFEVCRSGGPGGQHVNKTESAVRATYAPLGLTTICSDERSQHANKKKAVQRLKAMAALREAERQAAQDEAVWRQKGKVTRGGQALIFEGEAFTLRKQSV